MLIVYDDPVTRTDERDPGQPRTPPRATEPADPDPPKQPQLETLKPSERRRL